MAAVKRLTPNSGIHQYFAPLQPETIIQPKGLSYVKPFAIRQPFLLTKRTPIPPLPPLPNVGQVRLRGPRGLPTELRRTQWRPTRSLFSRPNVSAGSLKGTCGAGHLHGTLANTSYASTRQLTLESGLVRQDGPKA